MESTSSHSAVSATTSVPAIRTAAANDLAAAAEVYQAASRGLFEQRRGMNPWTSEGARRVDLHAALTALGTISRACPDAVQVAEHDGVVVGVGAVVIRERHAHILFLFVDPARQQRGVGRALLDELRRVIAAAGCDVITLTASDDRRAWRRYLAMGLQPGAPLVSMRAPAADFPKVHNVDGVEAIPITLDTLEVVRGAIDDIDSIVKGARRAEDITHWLTEEGATGAVLKETVSELPVGYYLVSRDAWYGRIGPVAALEREWFPVVLQRALVAAGEIDNAHQLIWQIDLPAANRDAIEPLLRVGFTPWNLLPWFASGTIGQWDRYVFRDEDQL